MCALMNDNILTETVCGGDFALIIKDSENFSPYKYKILHGQSRLFVPCLKMLFNGETQLYYSCGGMKSFSSIAAAAESKTFIILAKNLLSAVTEVQANGLIDRRDIDVSLEKVFVDPHDCSVRLVYLPLSHGVFPDYASLEGEFRSALISLMATLPEAVRADLNMLEYIISDGALSFGEILGKIDLIYGPTGGVPFTSMKLISTNAPFPVELIVSKTPFVIGRSSVNADGVLSFSRSISRIHCEVSLKDGSYYITDLGSKGGTCINRLSLTPHCPRPIHNGDELELSGYVFRTVIE